MPVESAVVAAGDGAEVTLVAPMAQDDAGRLLRAGLEAAGVRVVALPQQGATREKSRVRVSGQSLLRLDRGGPASPAGGALPTAAEDAIDRAVATGAPQKYSWLLAHGLIVTLVWLYIEFLRLFARLRSE